MVDLNSIREVADRSSATSQRSRSTKADKAEGRIAYLFLAPWLLGLFALTLGPVLASLYLSFTDFDLITLPHWIGIQNYLKLFSDPHLRHSVSVTILYVIISVPLSVAFALLVAVALSGERRGVGLYRSIYYLPSLLGGSVAIAVLWRQIFGPHGLINRLLLYFGIVGPSWISDPSYALYTLIVLHIWQFGSPMLIFLAGIKQVPRDLLEAAEVDGASRARRFFSVVMPLLSPLIFFNLVLQFINALKAFTPAFIVSGGTGGPLDSTLFYTLYLYQQGFTQFHMGYASAMAWALLLVTAAFTAGMFLTAKYWVFYGDTGDERQ